MAKERNNSQKVSFTEGIILMVISLTIIIGGSLLGLSTIGFALIVTIVLIAYATIFKDYTAAYLIDAWYDRVRGLLPAGLIVLFSGFTGVAWTLSGTIPFITIVGLKLLTPATALLVTFILIFITYAVTGQGWGVLATIGIACITMCTAFGINYYLTIGVVLSAAWLGDTLGLIGDTVNVNAAVLNKKPIAIVKNNMKVTLISFVISAVIVFIVGLLTQGSTSYDSATKAEYISLIEGSGNYSIVSLIPIVVLFVLIALKKDTLVCIVGSAMTGVIVACLTNGYGFIEAVNYCISGITVESESEFLAGLLSGDGAAGMYSIMIMLIAITAFATLFIELGIPSAVLSKLSGLANNVTSLSFLTLFSILALGLSTGGTYSVMTLINSMYGEQFEKLGYDRTACGSIVTYTITLITMNVPWSANYYTFAIIGFTGNVLMVLPYMIGNMVNLVILCICFITKKGLFHPCDPSTDVI